MKTSLVELYEMLGVGMAISFQYDDLPDDVVVTIGFSRHVEERSEEEVVNDESKRKDGTASAGESGEPGEQAAPGWRGRTDLH